MVPMWSPTGHRARPQWVRPLEKSLGALKTPRGRGFESLGVRKVRAPSQLGGHRILAPPRHCGPRLVIAVWQERSVGLPRFTTRHDG